MSRRAIICGAVAAAVALSLFAGGVAAWQLARPVPARIGPPPQELAAEAVNFSTESGSAIHGWFSRVDRGRGAVLLLPPIRANRLAMVSRAKFLRAAGYTTLLVDLQATGESAGEAITFGWRERLDVLAAVQFLHQRLPGQPVGIIGVSLGGAAALLATPPLHVQALVLEAVYPSIDVAVENRLRMRAGSPGAWLAPVLLLQVRPRIGVDGSRLRPADHIRHVQCPVLVIGGMEDRHTTMEDTRLLYAAAREPKELWLIPGAGHADYLEAAGDEYRQRVGRFLTRAFDNVRHARP